jgi:hypothetical protein
MKNKRAVNRVLLSALSLALSTPISVAANEIELANITPTVKTVNLRLKGSEREKVELKTIHDMVQDILNNSKLGVVRLPVPDASSIEPGNMAAESLEIIIAVKSPLTTQGNQPYEVTITLQEEDLEGLPEKFEYYPNKPDQIYQDLKDYLTDTLNLQPKSTTPKTPTPAVVSPTETIQSSPPMASIEEFNQVSPNRKEAKNISLNQELQLKNLTPVIKEFSIKLRGTEREKEELDTVYTMVNDILNSSRLGVVRVPVDNEPKTTPILKTYENLEIVIGMKSPETKEQPYQVRITLHEKGTEEVGESQSFKYQPEDWEPFFNELKAFLTKHLNLQPR